MTDTTERFFDAPYDTQPPCDPERVKQLEYHVTTGDYFPVLATVLGFLEEGMKQCEEGVHEVVSVTPNVIEGLRKDLLHLHRNYQIQPKHQ